MNSSKSIIFNPWPTTNAFLPSWDNVILSSGNISLLVLYLWIFLGVVGSVISITSTKPKKSVPEPGTPGAYTTPELPATNAFVPSLDKLNATA